MVRKRVPPVGRGPWLVLAGFLVMATAFNAGVPLFEAPDEHTHYFFAQHLAHGGSLPVQPAHPDDRGPWEQEGSQPPLYYALAAAVVRTTGARLEPDELQVNHQNTMGHPALRGNENRFVHDPAREGWPWHGYALAVHLVRGLSTALGALTVAATVFIARVALPDRPALSTAAAGVVAFNPQFLALSATVSNDNLVIAMAAVSLALVLVLADGRPGGVPRRQVAALAIGAGMAPLAKLSGLALTGFVVASLAFLAWRAARRTGGAPTGPESSGVAAAASRAALAVTVVATVGCGWWYARNLALYGDFTGIARMLPGDTRRDFELADWLAGLPAEVGGLWFSTWGLFGWFTILLPAWAYLLVNVGVAGSALGWARIAFDAHARRALIPRPAVAAWLGLWIVIAAGSLLRWMTIAKGAQGRLLFPALPAAAILLVAGWRGLGPARSRGADGAVLAAGTLPLAALAVFSLFGVVRPALSPPSPIAALPESAGPVTAAWIPPASDGARLTLAGARLPVRVPAGQAFEANFYWRAEGAIARADDAFVAVRIDQEVAPGGGAAGADLAIVPGSAALAYPGAGTLPPAFMRPGELYADRRFVDAPPIAGRLDMPIAARLSVHLYDQGGGRRWPLVPPAAADEWATHIVLAPPERLELPAAAGSRPQATFDPGIELFLEAADVGLTSGTLQVWWRATAAVGRDLTAFVHVLEEPRADSGSAATFDRPPATHGRFPTRYWLPGDVISSTFPIELPEGASTILIGLYDPVTGERMAAFGPDGAPLENNALAVARPAGSE